MKKVIYCLIGLMGIFFNKSNAQTGNDVTQLIIMRHAEKEQVDSVDPSLSAAGKQRAERLAVLLKDVNIDELYVTPFRRTAQTLAPLAEAKQLKAELYHPGQLQDLARKLLAKKGKTIVIAGHANTSPELVNMLLGENRYAPLSENEFGKIWMLTLSNGKALSALLINTN